jgi:hypothetical protein
MLNRRQPDATLVASKQESQTSAVARTDTASGDTENAMNSNATASSANLTDDSASMSNTATTAATTTTRTTTTTANIATPTRRAANANSNINTKEVNATSALQNNNLPVNSVNAPPVADRKQQPATSEKQNFDDEAIRVTNRNRAPPRGLLPQTLAPTYPGTARALPLSKANKSLSLPSGCQSL